MAVKVIGLPRLNRKIRNLTPETVKRLQGAIVLGSQALENSMKTSVRLPGQGVLYTTNFITIGRGPTRRVIATTPRTPHRASAPGDPPASDTGRLLGSITTTFFNNRLAAEIGPATSYARFLEFGTDRMAPRPFVVPAYTKNRKAITRALGQAVKDGARSVSR